MKKIYSIALALGLVTSAFAQNEQELHHLSSFYAGGEGSAEVVAYDAVTEYVFYTSSENNSFSILNISNPNAPVLVKDVDLSPYGAGPNSIAVSNGLVAVAVEDSIKQNAGRVVFFDVNGFYQKTITAGALPDMLVFTSDGTKVLVANEGEPNDDYTVDPEGSITIIHVGTDISNATASQIDLSKFNSQEASIKNKGVRLFGPNASVAQDLEPEYITLLPDTNLAYVICQENNAFLVINIDTEEIIDIQALGYKNHQLGNATVESHILNQEINNWPSLGTPVYGGGQPAVMLGGFSGLTYDASQSTPTEYVFYAVPDRGPNDGAVSKATVTPATPQNLRPFKLPNYQARLVQFTLNTQTGMVSLTDSVMLFRTDGTTPISGKGNIDGFDEVPVTYTDASTMYNNVDFTDANGVDYHALPYDEMGGDFEGILRDNDGNFWLCDEYRPGIFKFNSAGVLIDKYVPQGTSLMGISPQPTGTFGNETLPQVYGTRRANRGFEAIAYNSETNVVYAFIQSPLYNPNSGTKNNSDVIRILGIDASNGQPVEEYIYALEANKHDYFSSSRVDKIGGAQYLGNDKFYVIERDSEGPENVKGKKFVFEISLKGATNIVGTPLSADTLEGLSLDAIVDLGVYPVHKTKAFNLPTIGYASSDKAEGITLLPNNQIAVINDNDFGLAGAGITDNSVLGIISFDGKATFDASNKDNKINMKNYPTLGMYMPDGISSFSSNGDSYVITANEGDSRDYDGYSEEVRVKDLELDSILFPNANYLQQEEVLGRLKTTTANGDFDMDGKTDQIYSYGGRSFSIFDIYGNLVFDSGDDFGKTVAILESALFNEDDGEKDGRSDDKGVEPEAVSVGTINGYTYAFIGFERQSAIVVYDITDPTSPEYITYYTNRMVSNGTVDGDISPEIIQFVPADESPNSENLLVVGYEVSGTVGLIQIGGALINGISEELEKGKSTFLMYPNPTQNNLTFDQPLTGEVLDLNGSVIATFTDAINVEVSKLPKGVYFIRTADMGMQQFVKM